MDQPASSEKGPAVALGLFIVGRIFN